MRGQRLTRELRLEELDSVVEDVPCKWDLVARLETSATGNLQRHQDVGHLRIATTQRRNADLVWSIFSASSRRLSHRLSFW